MTDNDFSLAEAVLAKLPLTGVAYADEVIKLVKMMTSMFPSDQHIRMVELKRFTNLPVERMRNIIRHHQVELYKAGVYIRLDGSSVIWWART